jgi:guanylate kinase
MPKGKLILVTGPSGVGKKTLIDHALENIPDCVFSVSATTRQPRPGEVDGREYHFLTRVDFERGIESGDFAEYAEYGGNYYGTPYRSIEGALESGKNVLLELEVQGAKQLMKKMSDTLSIFIMPPLPYLESLRERLERRIERTGEKTDIDARLAISAKEIEEAHLFSCIIINDDLQKAKLMMILILAKRLGISTM